MLPQHFISVSPYVPVSARGSGKDGGNCTWLLISAPEKVAFSVIRISLAGMEPLIRHSIDSRWLTQLMWARRKRVLDLTDYVTSGGKNVAFLIWQRWSSLLDSGCRFPADLPRVISHRAADQSNKREPTRFNLRIKLPFLHPPMFLTSSCLGEEDYQLPNDTVGERGRSELQLKAAAGCAGCRASLTSGLWAEGSCK